MVFGSANEKMAVGMEVRREQQEGSEPFTFKSVEILSRTGTGTFYC